MYPLNKETVQTVIDSFHLSDFSHATIRDIVGMSMKIEQETGVKFARMEMGVPGLKASQIGIDAEIEALERGVPAAYPAMEGIAELKEETARFVKAFMNVDVFPEHCVPTVGSMNGLYASFLLCGQAENKKDTVLFIDPCFSVKKLQLQVLGYASESFDIYNFRGEKLREKLESYLKEGNISCIIYSNPNNPSWICLKDEELRIIGEVANKYDTIVIEDLAYFGMDFRQELSVPFQAPYQVSVAHYTDNYILLISASKIFSYAGQRIGVVSMSPKLYDKAYPDLEHRYGVASFGEALISRVLYSLSSGVSHSAQYAMAAMLKAASDGKYDFLNEVKLYGERAADLKPIFLANGFHIVYDKDLEEDIADGFYFTVGYEGMKGYELMYHLLFYGISAVSLNTTGSKQEGVRICTSFVQKEQYQSIEASLKAFHKDFQF